MRMKSNKKQAVGYIRVASSSQNDIPLSMQKQHDAILKFCNCEGYALVGCYEDAGSSGASLDRLGMQEMIAFCHEEEFDVDLIVATEPTRFSRSAFDFLQLLLKLDSFGIQVEYADQEAADKVLFPLDDLEDVSIGWALVPSEPPSHPKVYPYLFRESSDDTE